MRVEVDYDTCVSTGSCARTAPEVFQLSNEGILTVLQAEPPESLRFDVEAAAELCPVAAITVED